MREETKIQCRAVLEFSQQRKEERGRFFSVHNNADNVVSGTIATALGRYPGVSDTIYLGPTCLWCIEFKDPKGMQSKDQKDWQATVSKLPYVQYRIAYSVEDFWKIWKEAQQWKIS